MLSSNFLASLFGCRVQEAFRNNMWLKHLLGFMTLFLFVVVIDSKSKWGDSPQKQIIYSLLFYVIFVITTRMDYKWWTVFIIGICLIYILQVFKDHEKTQEDEREKYQKYQSYLIYIAVFVMLIGFIIYYGRKKAEYGDEFKHLTFFLGKPNCALNKDIVKLSDFQAFMKAFSK